MKRFGNNFGNAFLEARYLFALDFDDPERLDAVAILDYSLKGRF